MCYMPHGGPNVSNVLYVTTGLSVLNVSYTSLGLSVLNRYIHGDMISIGLGSGLLTDGTKPLPEWVSNQ